MEDSKVSIIVPIYNVEKYLEDCLHSLEKQTYKNIEVLMINDSSPDNSKSIAQSFADKHDNFVLIDRPNGGLSAARNSGIENATGDYIYFLDSDDYLVDTAIEELIIEAQKKQTDVLKCSAFVFDDDSPELSWNYEGYKYHGDWEGVYEGNEFIKKAIGTGDIYNVSCALILVKREVIDNFSLRFHYGIIHEDILFSWELLSVSNRVGVYNKPLYCRRFRQGSIMQTKDWNKKIYSMAESIDEAYLFIKKNSLSEKANRWYLSFFALRVMQHWIGMEPSDRKDITIRKNVNRVRRQILEHSCWGKINMFLFAIHPNIYLYYNRLGTIVRKHKIGRLTNDG